MDRPSAKVPLTTHLQDSVCIRREPALPATSSPGYWSNTWHSSFMKSHKGSPSHFSLLHASLHAPPNEKNSKSPNTYKWLYTGTNGNWLAFLHSSTTLNNVSFPFPKSNFPVSLKTLLTYIFLIAGHVQMIFLKKAKKYSLLLKYRSPYSHFYFFPIRVSKSWTLVLPRVYHYIQNEKFSRSRDSKQERRKPEMYFCSCFSLAAKCHAVVTACFVY